MIKLVKHSLTPAGRFEVESCSLTLSEKDSQIVMTLGPDAMELQLGDWLLDDEEPGAGIVYRVKTIETDYQTKTRRVTAEHIIQTLRDAVIFGTVDAETMGGSDGVISAAGAIGYALSQCADWQPGTIGYNTSQPYEFNGDSVLEAIETVCTTLVDPWWSYDLSSYPFTLNINPKSSAAQCEMRSERNITTLRRTVDMSRMYTRIYPVGKDDLHITGDYLSQNENIYGVIAKVETDQSKETAGMLQAWAAARLARHCNPSVTIQITGANLSASTGEPLDHLQIGVGCRVPLPEFNTTILETISKLQWKDKKADPESVTVTLANDWEDVASIMRREIASGSGTTGKAGRTRSKQQKEDHAWFVDTDDHVAMVAEAIAGTDGQGKPNWSRVSTLTVDGNGIDSRVTTTESGLVTAQSAIVQTENSISMSVGTLKNLTLDPYDTKSQFPKPGASNKLYLDRATGIYWVYVNGQYSRAKFVSNNDGTPVTDSSGKVPEVHFAKAGEIVLYINEDGSATAKIDAKKVLLGTITEEEATSDYLLSDLYDDADNGDGVFAKYLTVRSLTAREIEAMFTNIGLANIAAINAGEIHGTDIVARHAYIINPFITVGRDDDGESLGDYPMAIYDASVSGNTLTINRINPTTRAVETINFSKATTLKCTPGTDGIITVKGYQTNRGVESNVTGDGYRVGFGNGTAELHLALEFGTPTAVSGNDTQITVPYSVKTQDDDPQKIVTVYSSSTVVNGTIPYNNATVDRVALADNYLAVETGTGVTRSQIYIQGTASNGKKKDDALFQLGYTANGTTETINNVSGTHYYATLRGPGQSAQGVWGTNEIIGRINIDSIYNKGVTDGQGSMGVDYNSSYTPSGASEAIKAVVPSANGSAYLQISTSTGTLNTNTGKRTVSAMVGNTAVDSKEISDYTSGYNAGYDVGGGTAKVSGSNSISSNGTYTFKGVYEDQSGDDQETGHNLTVTVAVPIPDTTATYNYAARYGSFLDDFGASTAAQSATIAGDTNDEDGEDIAYQGELKAGWMYGLYYIKSNSSKYYKAYWKVPEDRYEEGKRDGAASVTAESHSYKGKVTYFGTEQDEGRTIYLYTSGTSKLANGDSLGSEHSVYW